MSYRYLDIGESDPTNDEGVFLDANPVLADVRKSFRALRDTGDELMVQVDNRFPDDHYEFDYVTDLAGEERTTHFQGVQRLNGDRGAYLVISGADDLVNESHLFVAKLGSRQAHGPWRANSVDWVGGPPEDAVVGTILVDPNRWHAGGISVCGDLLAVPVYLTQPEEDCSILFLNMKDPECPLRLSSAEIRRPGVKAGAVAVAKLPSNGHFLIAVWSDSDHEPNRFDFYRSSEANIYRGFDSGDKVTWEAQEPLTGDGIGPRFHRYQNIDLLVQHDGQRREQLFLVGTYSTRLSGYGKDRAELFEVVFPDSVFSQRPTLAPPSIIRRCGEPGRFRKADGESTFAGAAGCSVDASGTLRLYRAHRYRRASYIGVDEFHPIEDRVADVIDRMEDSFIELFTKRQYGGRRMSLRNLDLAKLRSYLLVTAQGADFDTNASSLRFQLPPGKRYVLYSDTGLRGNTLELVGTGEEVEIQDLEDVALSPTVLYNGGADGTVDFNNRARSSQMAV